MIEVSPELHTKQTTTPTQPADFDPTSFKNVWILAGQSNMEGVGELSESAAPSDLVWSFTSGGNWEVAAEPLHRFWESFTPIHQNLIRPGLAEERRRLSDSELAALATVERAYGAGLGMAFGSAMATALNGTVGLLPCAHGATSLDQWSPQLKQQGGLSLYGALFERIKKAGCAVSGLLWYQGESEGWDVAAGVSYGRRFEEWVASLRGDIGDPNFPVLVVQIGRTMLDSPNAQAWNAVQQAQYDLPDRVPNTAVTSAIDLPLVDVIHINAGALKRLGRRLARMALALLSGHCEMAGPRLIRVESGAEAPDRGLVRLAFSGVSGGWTPSDNMAGFEVLGADGQVHPVNHVIDAFRDKSDPSAIRVRLNLPLRAGEMLTYGHGLRAYCNVVDEADMPLCAGKLTLNAMGA